MHAEQAIREAVVAAALASRLSYARPDSQLVTYKRTRGVAAIPKTDGARAWSFLECWDDYGSLM